MEMSNANKVRDVEVKGTLNALINDPNHQPLNAATIDLRSTQYVKYEFRGRTNTNDRSFIFQIFRDLEDGTHEIPSTYSEYAAVYLADHSGTTYASPNGSTFYLTISGNKTRFVGNIQGHFDPIEHKAPTLNISASLDVTLSQPLFPVIK